MGNQWLVEGEVREDVNLGVVAEVVAGQLGKAAWGCSDNLSFSSEINCGAEGFSKLDHHELYVPLNEEEHAVVTVVSLR